MLRVHSIVFCVVLISARLCAVPKAHVVALGRSTVISWRTDGEDKPVTLKLRALLVDGRTKEFTVGQAHDVTERTFVVQRIYKLNDSLPQESGPSRWRWQLGGWLLVDRTSGKIRQITL